MSANRLNMERKASRSRLFMIFMVATKSSTTILIENATSAVFFLRLLIFLRAKRPGVNRPFRTFPIEIFPLPVKPAAWTGGVFARIRMGLRTPKYTTTADKAAAHRKYAGLTVNSLVPCIPMRAERNGMSA